MLLRSLLAASFGMALAAQTPPCISLNDATTSVGTTITAFGFAGPGVNAYQFTPATSLVLRAAQIFTASTPFGSPRGYQTLEIWDTNFIFLPQARLGGGTWQNQPTTPLVPAWQGASFDFPVTLTANQTYWLVWRESGGNLLPYEPGGTGTSYARLSGSTWTLQANAQPIKWRGFCSLLDDAYVLPLGQGCQSSIGKLPSSFTNTPPAIGNANFQWEATGFAAGSLALAVVGANPAWTGIPIPGAPAGCLSHAEPMVLTVVPVGTGNEQAVHTTGCAGHCWFDLPLPNDPLLIGFSMEAQFAGLDVGSSAPLPFVFTNGLRVTLY